jgi:hypothetical protein
MYNELKSCLTFVNEIKVLNPIQKILIRNLLKKHYIREKNLINTDTDMDIDINNTDMDIDMDIDMVI